MSSIWDTPGIMEDLAKYWGEGMTGTQISEDLNKQYKCSLTRNAVMAKLDRMKLLGGRRSTNSVALKTAAARGVSRSSPSKVPKPQTWFAIRNKPQPIEPYVERELRNFDLSKVVSFENLEDHHCKATVGLPSDLMFCGETAVPGLSWCAACAKIVFGSPDVSSVDAMAGSEGSDGISSDVGREDALDDLEASDGLSEGELEGVL